MPPPLEVVVDFDVWLVKWWSNRWLGFNMCLSFSLSHSQAPVLVGKCGTGNAMGCVSSQELEGSENHFLGQLIFSSWICQSDGHPMVISCYPRPSFWNANSRHGSSHDLIVHSSLSKCGLQRFRTPVLEPRSHLLQWTWIRGQCAKNSGAGVCGLKTFGVKYSLKALPDRLGHQENLLKENII